MTFEFAPFEWVQAPARHVHTLDIGCFIQAAQHGGQSWGMGNLDASHAPFLEKAFQAFMPECLNHGALYRVTLRDSTSMFNQQLHAAHQARPWHQTQSRPAPESTP